ncbi:hypothetical protein [Streptomyces sp. NPDC055036]
MSCRDGGNRRLRAEVVQLLTTRGVSAVEADRPDRKARRGNGKSNLIDA